MPLLALPLLKAGAQIGGQLSGGVLGSYIAKAQGHSTRVARKSKQVAEASSLGLSYECIRVRDAAFAAGVAFTGDSGGKSQDKIGGAACDAYAAKIAQGGSDYTRATTSAAYNTSQGTGDSDHPNPVMISSVPVRDTTVNPSAPLLQSNAGASVPSTPKTTNASIFGASGASPLVIGAVVIVGVLSFALAGGHR